MLMNERPELNKELDAITFRSFYYPKQELIDFCRENELPTSGDKIELTVRIRIVENRTALSKSKKPKTFGENEKVAREGGSVAKSTRKNNGIILKLKFFNGRKRVDLKGNNMVYFLRLVLCNRVLKDFADKKAFKVNI
mgnify:CR=1 FL=1